MKEINTNSQSVRSARWRSTRQWDSRFITGIPLTAMRKKKYMYEEKRERRAEKGTKRYMLVPAPVIFTLQTILVSYFCNLWSINNEVHAFSGRINNTPLMPLSLLFLYPLIRDVDCYMLLRTARAEYQTDFHSWTSMKFAEVVIAIHEVT